MKETRKDLQKVCKLYQEKGADKVTLLECPVGLFVWEGALVLKTEYKSPVGGGELRDECYLVESGEVFHGGAQITEEYNSLMVTPIIVGYGLKAGKPANAIAGARDLDAEDDKDLSEAPKTGLTEVYEDIGK